MCLAVPGKLTAVTGGDDLTRVGRVDFGGVARDVSLAFVPDARPGDYVLVHVGFAISRIDEQAARETLEALAAIDELASAEAAGASEDAAGEGSDAPR
jgi:hydrogenase expression/formation protein HypC